jgi:hypothetical protein
MLTDFLYEHLKDRKSRPATWALRQVFNMRAINNEDAKHCANIMHEMGAERLSMLREWMPITMPETLDANSLAEFRKRLEHIDAWDKKIHPRTPHI